MTGTERKILSLEEDFQPLVKQLLEATEKATGIRWGVSDGRRTLKEQAAIYAQGRTKPGKVVSNAPPGTSAHNFGYAVDCWPLTKDGKGFDWGAEDKLFKVMANEAKKLGLTPGYYFKSIHDAPHVESEKWKVKQLAWREGKLSVA